MAKNSKGVSQESILGLLLFGIVISDLFLFIETLHFATMQMAILCTDQTKTDSDMILR